MEEKNTKEGTLSYDQLKEVAAQLQHENQQLRSTLVRIDYSNTFKRLDYLFKVLDNYVHFDDDFVTSCIKEIQDMMTIKEESTEDTEDSNSNNS